MTTSCIRMLLCLGVGIGLIIVLTAKFRMHAFFALILACFAVGFILLLIQDLKGLSTINLGFSWPWAIMYYIGLLLLLLGYYLRG